MKEGTETGMLIWTCKVTSVALSPLHHKLYAPVQFVFMDNENYEETRLKRDDAWAKYMKEGTEASLLFWNGKVISVDPPTNMELEVTDTDPGVKGNTVSGHHPSKTSSCKTEHSHKNLSIYTALLSIALVPKECTCIAKCAYGKADSV